MPVSKQRFLFLWTKPLLRQGALSCVSRDIITRHVCYQQPTDMWGAEAVVMGIRHRRYRSASLGNVAGWRLTLNQCKTNIISCGIFGPPTRNNFENQLWHRSDSSDFHPARWTKRPWQFERGSFQDTERCRNSSTASWCKRCLWLVRELFYI